MLNPTTQARAETVLVGTGVLIRYGFYAAGLILFALLASGLLTLYQYVPRRTDAPPAFRLDTSEFASLPASSEVVTSRLIGRSEARYYGQLHSRKRDLSILLSTPSAGAGGPRIGLRDIESVPFLRAARAIISPPFYDLETRFGEFRAATMYVDTDGRRKLCLAFVSSFDTEALSIKGWTCEADGSRPSPDALACLLGRLVLDRPLASPEADRYMRERLGRAASCHAAPVTFTTDTRTRIPRPGMLRR